MSKRIIALLLSAVMLLFCFAGCASKDEEETDLGAYITMYLTDDIYDFDPANAYYNADTLNVVSLMYDTLFTLEEDGDVKKSLVKDYEFLVDKRTGEHYMEITLHETFWSNGIQLSADDVAFAWRRLLTSSNGFAAASLLFDIKNARAVKEGDESIDNVGIEAVSVDTLKVTFEGPIDYDQFILNLTSVATAPLLENYVTKNEDWAKKPSTMVTSGPFKLGKIVYSDILNDKGNSIEVRDDNAKDASGEYGAAYSVMKEVNYFYLERNVYYLRDVKRDKINSSVTGYRILVDCTKTDAQLLEDYQNGKLFYIGSIPASLRGDAFVTENAKITDALSTFVCYMNEYAVINDGGNGSMLFSNKAVRQALSLAIDRNAIASAVVYAKAASGFVCPGVFNEGKISKNDFRTVGGNILNTAADTAAAGKLLSDAGIDASKYSFSIKVPSYDEQHVTIVNMIAESWKALGFNVTVEEVSPVANNDYLKEVGAVPTDVCDDLFVESIKRNNYEVIAFDYNAYSVDAYSMLSNFATAFSGMGLDTVTYKDATTGQDVNGYINNKNSTGYYNINYDNLMEAIYYIPYFASLDTTTSKNLVKIKTEQPYIETAAMLAESARALAADASALATKAPTLTTKADKTNSLNKAIIALQNATLELQRSYETSAQTFAKKAELEASVAAAITAVANIAGASSADETTAVQAGAEAIFASVALFNTAAAEAAEAAKLADARTLYEIVSAIYAENGITPSTKTSDWTKQKAVLLHKAETILLEDMPVIPVIFNQNAVIVSKDLTKVSNTYYIPAYFRKTNLKNYKDYTYVDDKGETVSIFAEFPAIAWDKIGK